LIKKGIRLKFKIKKGIIENAAYLKGLDIIRFKNEDEITERNLAEELIHAVQHKHFYGDKMTNKVVNYEFEAKVFQDFANEKAENLGWISVVTNGVISKFQERYKEHYLKPLVKQGSFTPNNIRKFNWVCRIWQPNSDYYNRGKCDPNFTPKLLLEFLKHK
jgi:hypothetical protein